MSTTATPATYGHDASIARFSVARYQKMIEVGILTPDDKVELLENYVVLKMPRNPPHDGTIQIDTEALAPLIPAGWRLRVQLTVVVPDSQPEPDFAIVRGDARTYLTRHPGPADVGLLIEVADSSLLRDQRDKARIYARANIPHYWIVNLVDHQVEVYAQPSGPTTAPTYGSVQNYGSGNRVPLVLDGAAVGTVAVSDLLP
jgi:Uma2 family endonuclease